MENSVSLNVLEGAIFSCVQELLKEYLYMDWFSAAW